MMLTGHCYSALLVVLLMVFEDCSEPVAGNSHKKRVVDDFKAYDDSLQHYLTRFGYLPEGNLEMSNLRKDDSIQLALTRLQEFAGLNPTGRLDRKTRRLINSKRCGLPDVPYDGSGDILQRKRVKRYVLHGSKWPKFNLTYMVKNAARTLDLPRTRRVLYDAFQVWSKASRLKFQETADELADIVTSFASGHHGDSYPFDGPNVVLAHAFFPAAGLGGDIHFDDDEPWTDDPGQTGNNVVLLSTAAHEIGHSLGLGHSKVQESLMYPYYKYDMNEIKLEYDDIKAVQSIYGVGAEGVPEQPAIISSTITPRRWEGSDDVTSKSAATPSIVVTTPSYKTPEPCDSHIDAIAKIRNEIFVFKNQYYWRFNENGDLVERPSSIYRFWHGLPKNATKIDAIYERADKNRIIIFIGRLFYEFNGNRLTNGGRDVTDLGLPDDVRNVDAAFVWEYNDRTYFFSAQRYWRFDEERRIVEPDYPRSVATVWRRLPDDGVDAAFTDKAGVTYFFKDHLVYKFNNYFMRVEKNYPKSMTTVWEYCSLTKRVQQPQQQQQHRQQQMQMQNTLINEASSHFTRVFSHLFCICVFYCACYCTDRFTFYSKLMSC